MRILWLDPIGTDRFSSDVANILRRVRREGTEVDVMYLGPFKFAEFLAETASKLGWYPSRKWGSEAPPTQEIEAWQLFKQPLSELGGIL
jgi:hypothetical protein